MQRLAVEYSEWRVCEFGGVCGVTIYGYGPGVRNIAVLPAQEVVASRRCGGQDSCLPVTVFAAPCDGSPCLIAGLANNRVSFLASEQRDSAKYED